MLHPNIASGTGSPNAQKSGVLATKNATPPQVGYQTGIPTVAYTQSGANRKDHQTMSAQFSPFGKPLCDPNMIKRNIHANYYMNLGFGFLNGPADITPNSAAASVPSNNGSAGGAGKLITQRGVQMTFGRLPTLPSNPQFQKSATRNSGVVAYPSPQVRGGQPPPPLFRKNGLFKNGVST